MTNKMLDALRAAGHYEGRNGRPKWAFAYDKYAVEAASIRSDVGNMTRRWVGGAVATLPASLKFWFEFVGHERYDNDAGLLPAKELIDGICAAMGYRSDRAVVRGTWVYNCTSVRESEDRWFAYLDELKRLTPAGEESNRLGPGVLIRIDGCMVSL
jgi:hypothetical protein